MTFIKDPQNRKWIYGIIAAAIPILVLNGLLTNEEAGQWLFLVAAILGLGGAGLALPNTKAPEVVEVAPEIPEGTGKHRA